jgi:LPPG:FO 2-phospho-L-lactate transferase
VKRVTLLSGGVGGSKLALGLYTTLDPESLTVIANTGDDIDLFGLHISPDLDTVAYTLSGRVNPQQGWGVAGETWNTLHSAMTFGAADWFRLGDKDLGLHLYRTGRLRSGDSLSEITRDVTGSLGLRCKLLPMCDQPVSTRIVTGDGDLHLQEYLVRRACEPVVREIRYDGIERSKPAPGLLDALENCDVVILAPSNPFISIGPILSVPGARDALRGSKAKRLAVSPIVAGKALKGPLAKMMAELGFAVNQESIARMYVGLVDLLIVDEQDRPELPSVEAVGLGGRALPTVMDTLLSKQRLAQSLIELAS